MTWCTVHLEPVRSQDFAKESRHLGYLLHAPITREARIDFAAFNAGQSRAVVEEFRGDAEARRGRLVHRDRNQWCFVFGPGEEESVFHFEDHCFVPGEHISVRDSSGAELTYRVTTVARAT